MRQTLHHLRTGRAGHAVHVKRNSSRSEYDQGKLRASLSPALRKRPVSTEDVDAAVARIEESLLTSGKREVPSGLRGRTGDDFFFFSELRKLDKVAYVRFASVYRSFEDIGEFIEAIREMQGPLLSGKLRKEPSTCP